MKGYIVAICILFVSFSTFNQTDPLKEALRDLKDDLKKVSKYGIEKTNSTLFRADKFDSCAVSFHYYFPSENVSTFVDFDPISSSTGTFSNNNNPVFVPDRQNNGVVTRNESLSRTNISNTANSTYIKPTKLRETTFNFKYVLMDSISVVPTSEKKFFILKFDVKEVTTEYKIEEKYDIYLKSDSLKKAEETMAKFKTVASLCQETVK